MSQAAAIVCFADVRTYRGSWNCTFVSFSGQPRSRASPDVKDQGCVKWTTKNVIDNLPETLHLWTGPPDVEELSMLLTPPKADRGVFVLHFL